MPSVICVSGGLKTSSTQKVLPMLKPKHEDISKITYVPTHPHAELTLFRTRGNEVGVTNNSRERGVIKNEGKHRVIQILQLNTPTGSVKESYLPSRTWRASPCVLPGDSLWMSVHCTHPRLEDSSLARAEPLVCATALCLLTLIREHKGQRGLTAWPVPTVLQPQQDQSRGEGEWVMNTYKHHPSQRTPVTVRPVTFPFSCKCQSLWELVWGIHGQC